MVDKSREPSISELNRKLKRLEMLVMALIASDGIGFDSDSDDMFHLFRRFTRDREDFRDDSDFYRFFERFLYESRDRKSEFKNGYQRLDNQISELQSNLLHRNEEAGYSIKKLSEEIQSIDKNQKVISKELHHYLMYQFLGDDLKNLEMNRYIPVRVYLADNNNEDITKITNAISGVLDAYGFQFSDDFPAEKGSWWKKWFAKSKDAITQKEVTDRLEKIERAFDIKGVHKPQADVDKIKAEAIATLTTSVKDIPNAAIQSGSILLVKVTDQYATPCLQVRTLTTKELIYLENNQHLLCKPGTVMESLSNGVINLTLPTSD
jgi:hypothetical protein